MLDNVFKRYANNVFLLTCLKIPITLKIAHIINPFNGSAQHISMQDITFESLKRAKEYATNCEVELVSTHYAEDETVVPSYITKKVVLIKSVLDYNKKLSKRLLPTLKDILTNSIAATDADYIVFTNIDIGVQQNFYQTVKEIIGQGHDAFVINRRRIGEQYQSTAQLNQIYANAGELHNGYDCFVFKKELFSQFQLGNVCIGIPHVGNTLFFNLMCFAKSFRLCANKHLTFHIGYDLVRPWGSQEFLNHNKTEYKKVIAALKQHLTIKNVPGSGLPFFKRHLKWLMNPTIHYPTVAALDFKSFNAERYKQSGKKPKGYYEWMQKKVKLD